MRGRRRGLGLGNYTLGDRYVTPERRLSQMLIRQGSRGGPSDSWQESMGRIAQQLAGAYIGYKDQQNRNVANRAFAKVEPDTYSMQPTMNDQQIMESDKVQDILRPNTDEDRMSNPMIQRTMNNIGREQDIIADQQQILSDLQKKPLRNQFTDGGELMQVQGPLADKYSFNVIDEATQNIENYGDEFNRTMSRLNSQEPTDDQRAEAVGRELLGQRRASEVRTLNEKMPQIEYAMQNLRGLENNPYAQRLLQGLMMNQMTADAASRLAQTAREQELADIQSGRDYTSGENQLNRQARIDAVSAKPPVPGRDVPLPDSVQAQKIEQQKAGKNYETPLNLERRKKLEKENIHYLTPAQKKVDEVFAKDYAENYVTGGVADARKNLSQLDSVIGRLEGGKENLTGPVMGNMPDVYNEMMNPNMIDVKNTIEEVVQRNLRVILGAQFTEKEGSRLIARAYNPALDEKTNSKRIRRLMTAMEQALDAKDKAAQYYEDNGTMNGFKGTANFSMSDFESAVDSGDEGRNRRSTDGLSSAEQKELEQLKRDLGRQ